MRSEHIRAHTGQKPYECTIAGCEYKSGYRSDWHAHIRRHQRNPGYKYHKYGRLRIDFMALSHEDTQLIQSLGRPLPTHIKPEALLFHEELKRICTSVCACAFTGPIQHLMCAHAGELKKQNQITDEVFIEMKRKLFQ